MSAEYNLELTLFDPSVGDLSLAFIDTVNWRGREDPEEMLHSWADLFTWAREAGLLDASRAEVLAARAQSYPDEAQAALDEMILLREVLQRIFSALSGGLAPLDEDLQRFNQALSAALAQRQIQADGSLLHWAWRESASPLLDPFRPVFLAAADLMISEERSRIRTCSNDECGWMFLDRSRNQSRKWCSSESCGNRIRVRQFYSRARKPDSSSSSDRRLS